MPDGEAGRLMVAATYASVSIAVVLICAKLGAWALTDSVSLLSSLIDSLVDAAASLINLFAVRHALQPADTEHRFGHGKAESLAGLGQAAFIAGSGLFLLLAAITRISSPQAVENGAIGIAVMGVSIILTIGLVGFQSYVVRRTGSVAINADSLHYRVDILVNVAVIVSLLLAGYGGWDLADPLFAVAIIVYMSIGARKIFKQSLHDLMDTEFPSEDRKLIRQIALKHPKVRSLHDMRTRSSGPYSFIQFHIEMDRDITLLEAHEISDEVMYEVETAFPNTEVLIHQDPEGIEERRDHL
ncbi:MAG: cation diffusion facilitator family transporter [Rhodospirillales bacterium]|nr:cation diffusion facilitator family transporter [Rhodospirillales bacterium]